MKEIKMADFVESSRRMITEFANSLDETAYFAKFIEAFRGLPMPHKRGFLVYILDKIPRDKWDKDFKDDLLWLEIIRGLLVEYSGREVAKTEPTKQDLQRLVRDYVFSSQFKNALKDDKSSFMERLKKA